MVEQIAEMVHDKREVLAQLENQVKQAEETKEACKEVGMTACALCDHVCEKWDSDMGRERMKNDRFC